MKSSKKDKKLKRRFFCVESKFVFLVKSAGSAPLSNYRIHKLPTTMFIVVSKPKDFDNYSAKKPPNLINKTLLLTK
jgi:hypothetical protein